MRKPFVSPSAKRHSVIELPFPDRRRDLESSTQAKSHHAGASEEEPGAMWVVYAALIFTQVAFSVGAVYLKWGLQGAAEPLRPVVFALFREALASPPLLMICRWKTGVITPPRADVTRFLQIGFLLYLNQLLFIWGLHLSGAVMATCMQPSIPVVTVGLAVLLGLESGSFQKLAGILVAVGGALSMVVGSSAAAVAPRGEGLVYGFSGKMLLGNFCLIVNCFCAAGFYISVKTVSLRFHSAAITAWSYTTACILMLVTATLTVPTSQWHIPAGTEGPLVYWVVVSSIMGYCILTWATSRIPASHVAAMQCLQPFAGTFLGWAVLEEGISWWDLGAVAILAGLACVVSDKTEPGQKAAAAAAQRRAAAAARAVVDDEEVLMAPVARGSRRESWGEEMQQGLSNSSSTPGLSTMMTRSTSLSGVNAGRERRE